jgi:hypothetical protein
VEKLKTVCSTTLYQPYIDYPSPIIHPTTVIKPRRLDRLEFKKKKSLTQLKLGLTSIQVKSNKKLVEYFLVRCSFFS